MREKRMKKQGRKQRALRCLMWIGIMLALNTVFHGLPLFLFQARETMEIGFGLDRTRVIWEETADWGRWDGQFYCLSADEKTSIFYKMQYIPFYGWESSAARLLNKNTVKIVEAKWNVGYDSDDRTTIWALGYVPSSQVACIEYSLIWDDVFVETYKIPEDAYIRDGQDRYYVYDTEASVSRDDPEVSVHSLRITDVLVVARDETGEILYQEHIAPAWQ